MITSTFRRLLPGTALLLVSLAVPAAQPTPRLPDWSGEWEIVGITPDDGGRFVETPAELNQFWDRPPFNSDERQMKYQQDVMARIMAGGSPPHETQTCTWGFPELMVSAPTTFEFLATPNQTAIVFSSREVRNIYTDGRSHTPADERWPTSWGDSIGHWEGQTLVVETIAAETPGRPAAAAAFGAAIMLIKMIEPAPNQHYNPLVGIFSDSAKFVERIRHVSPGLIENRLTIHDPVALTAPWEIVRRYRRVVGLKRMVFQDCEGDDRHDFSGPRVRMKLPGEGEPAPK